MRRASCLTLLLVVACGHVVPLGEDREVAPTSMTEATDAGAIGTLDAATASVAPRVRCDPAAAFGALTAVTLPTLPLNLELFRASSGGAGVISLFDEDDNGAHGLRSFQLVGGAVTNVGSIGSAYDDKTLDQASLSADGRTLFLTRTKDPNDSDLLFARRDAVDQAFPAPTPILHAGLTDGLFGPYLVGRRLYFSRLPKRGNETVMVADFDPVAGAITNAMEVGALAPAIGIRWAPAVTEDELEVFFAHGITENDAQVMHATRPSVNVSFGAPTFVVGPPTGGNGFDYPTWISDDACTLWVVSNRGDAPAVLMRATRE